MVESLMFGLIRFNSNILSLIEYVFAEKDKKKKYEKGNKKAHPTWSGPGLPHTGQIRPDVGPARSTPGYALAWLGPAHENLYP